MPQPGSFAIVPASNRNISSANSYAPATIQQSGSQPIRFNPPLVVDGNREADELLQKQICQQVGRKDNRLNERISCRCTINRPNLID